jgi:hypothetical protein
MKIKKRRRLTIIGYAAVVIAVVGMFYLFHRNALGLAGFDFVVGGHPDMRMLRANTQAAADAFLSQHRNDLVNASAEPYEFAVDYSKSSRIRSLGYKSSFYYYCWDVYLPYSLRTQSGKAGTAIVHLSDGTPGYGHDVRNFRVLGVTVMVERGETTKTISGI